MAKHIGLDLGQATVKIYYKGKGIVLREPTVIAYDTVNGEVIAAGRQAYKMHGRTPRGKEAVRPLKNGVIDSYSDASELLLSFYKALGVKSTFSGPKLALGIPWGVSEVERNAFENVCLEAGAKSVTHLICQPMAAAVGAGINVLKAKGNLVCDIGGGKTQTAVISYRGVLHASKAPLGGQDLDSAIVAYIRNTYNVLIGDLTAEFLKKSIGSAHPAFDRGSVKVYGRDIVTGRGAEITISSGQVREAMSDCLEKISDSIRSTLENMPPRIASDIFEGGLLLCGGTSLLPGIEKLLSDSIGIEAKKAARPLDCIANGIGKIIDSSGELTEIVSRQEQTN